MNKVIIPILLFMGSVFCRALEQIAAFRPSYTILPELLIDKTSGAFGIFNGYHFASAFEWILAGLAGYVLARQGIRLGILLILSAYLIHGLIFDALYHYAFILPELRDYGSRALLGQIFTFILSR